MVKIIEHGNAGASAGFSAFGAGLGGFAEGMMAGEQLKTQKKEAAAQIAWLEQRTESERATRELMTRQANLQEKDRQATLAFQESELGELGIGGVPSGPSEQDLPGVQYNFAQWSPDKIEAWNSAGPELREVMLQDELDDRMGIRMEANVNRLEGWLMEMEGGGLGYAQPGAEPAGGGQGPEEAPTLDPEAQGLLDQGRMAVEMYRSNQITAQDAWNRVSGISDYLLERNYAAQEKVYYATMLGQEIERRRARSADGLGEDIAGTQYAEEIGKEYYKGTMPGYVALAMLSMSPGQAQGVVGWAQAQARGGVASLESQGGLGVTRPGEAAPAAGPNGLAPETQGPPAETAPPPAETIQAKSALEGRPKEVQKKALGSVIDAFRSRDSEKYGQALAEHGLSPEDPMVVEALEESKNVHAQQLDRWLDRYLKDWLKDLGLKPGSKKSGPVHGLWDVPGKVQVPGTLPDGSPIRFGKPKGDREESE